jgi:hypothetical protein
MANAQALEFAHHSLVTDLEADLISTVAAATLAIPVTQPFVSKTTGGAEALTLANGVPGQVLTIHLAVRVGDGTLTPALATGWATMIFTAAGDTATFLYVNGTMGWIVLGTAGVLAPPLITI